MSKTEKTAEDTAGKSAADLLIEMQLKAEQEKAINPLAIEAFEEATGDKTPEGVGIATRITFGNGSVMEHYA